VKMNNKQSVSREEYRRLDNRVICILQQRWPTNEISQWVGMLQGKQQAIACTILRRRHPNPASLALPAIAPRGTEPVSGQHQPPHRAGAHSGWPVCWPPSYREKTHPHGHRPELTYQPPLD
jgi:hypothetical protein